METEAVFENIAERITREIRKAQKSIIIAVAWFTNKNLYNELIEKAKSGCIISMMISNDSINLNSQNNPHLVLVCNLPCTHIFCDHPSFIDKIKFF